MAIVVPLLATAQKPSRYFLSQGYHAGHQAIDMVGYRGQPILAAESGQVFASSWNGDTWGIGGGNVILIDHFGPGGRHAKSSYAHLSARAVSKAQMVLRGQVIGWADSTGNSTGDHLHFGIGEATRSKDDYWGYKWIDPRRYMRAHGYENGSQGNGDLILSLHLRNSVVVKPGSNLRRGPSTTYASARITTGLELTCYLGSVNGQTQWGVRVWDKLWHPAVGVVYLHTNLGEWVL